MIFLPKPTLSIDIDGTLADSHSKWLELAREEFGINADRRDLVIYDFWKVLGLKNEEQCLDIFRKVWKNYEDIEPLNANVPEIIEDLGKKYNISINTACVGKASEVKSWLNYNKIDYDLFHFCKNREEKLSVKPYMHIDDSGELAYMFAQGGSRTILISQPWNASMQKKLGVHNRIRIANNWSDVAAVASRGSF